MYLWPRLPMMGPQLIKQQTPFCNGLMPSLRRSPVVSWAPMRCVPGPPLLAHSGAENGSCEKA
jgi:hypothetical protein